MRQSVNAFTFLFKEPAHILFKDITYVLKAAGVRHQSKISRHISMISMEIYAKLWQCVVRCCFEPQVCVICDWQLYQNTTWTAWTFTFSLSSQLRCPPALTCHHFLKVFISVLELCLNRVKFNVKTEERFAHSGAFGAVCCCGGEERLLIRPCMSAAL